MRAGQVKTAGLTLILLMLAASGAFAHVFLDHAEPRVGSQTNRSPTVVKIWFTGEIEPAFSAIQVWTEQGKQVDKKDSHLDPKDKTALIVSLNIIPPGTYKVTWQAVATDTHKTTGEFKFVVKPEGESNT